jgi:cytochrome c551/c552
MTRTQRFLTTATAAIALTTAAIVADDGEMVFKLKSCDTCHGVPAEKITAKIPSLGGPDLVDLDKKFDHATLSDYIQQKAEVNGSQHPRQFKGHEDELRVLVAWLLPSEDETGGDTP